VTSFTYDELGRVQTIIQPTATAGATAVTRMSYPGNTTVVADPNTNQAASIGDVPRTTYTYTTDGMKLIAKATDPSGNARSATYTSFLDVASAGNTAGTTTGSYSAQVNGGESLTGITGASGASSSFSYGNTGPAQYQPGGSTDGQGNASTYTYSGAGNKLSAADAAGAEAKVTYNNDGTVATATSPAGSVTTFGYDADKQLQSIVPPGGSSLTNRSYSYDGFGRMSSYTSGRGVTENYRYDAADRLTGTTYVGGGGGAPVTYTFDDAGQMTRRVDSSGTTTMTYDPLGRLASRVHSADGVKISYGYDKAGNLATVTDPTGATKYEYSSRNTVVKMVLPNGQQTDFGYDADGRRVDTWHGTVTGHATWDAHTRTNYDAAGRVTRIYTAQASNENNRASDLSYSYASNGTACSGGKPAGTITDLRQKMTDHVTGKVTTYCYDKANRLVSATTPGGDSFTYTYDANGNRLEQKKNGQVVQTQTVNSADQLNMTGYSFDASGNLTASPMQGELTYNATEQMTRRAGTTTDPENPSAASTYSYAGTNQNELITLTKPGDAVRRYTYGRTDSDGLPLIEAVAAGASRNYISYDPNGTPIAIRTANGQTQYYAEDGLGSTVALINQAGTQTADYTYDPNGEVTVTSPTNDPIITINPFRYAGGTYDYSSGLIKFGQRWYDPNTGRFTQQDSLETLADPSRANRYEYAASNPINYVDPTGMDFVGWGCFFSSTGMIVATAGVGLVSGPAGWAVWGYGMLGGGYGVMTSC